MRLATILVQSCTGSESMTMWQLHCLTLEQAGVLSLQSFSTASSTNQK